MLQVLDLLVVIVCLALFAFVGYYFRPKLGATSTDYFLARRQMSFIPAAFSISVSFFSSAGLTIIQGEVAMFALPLYATLLSAVISSTVATVFIINKFYDAPYLSIFQYLEHRFSRSVRVLSSLIFVVTGLVMVAVAGYTVAISAEVLAGVPFWVSIITAGLLSTMYSTMGGIRAVIWTDAAQAFLMVLFLVMISVKGLTSFQSLTEFTRLVSEGGRAELRFRETSADRYSVQSLVCQTSIIYLYMQCVSQPGVQRWRSVRTIADAKKTVILSSVFSALFSCLMFTAGLVLYAFYSRCANQEDPSSTITSDKLSLYFVLNELSSWPGAQGVCLAGLLSGALSTMSSFLNSLAAVTLEDCVKMWFKSVNEEHELTISKALTAAYGVASTVLAFLFSKFHAVAIIQMISMNVSAAPPLGIFFLGIWSKKANAMGVNLGLTVSIGLVVWMTVGSFMYGNRHVPLPTPQCPSNTTSIVAFLEHNILRRLPPPEDQIQRGFLDHLYGISFYWYAIINFLAAFIFGYLFSVCISCIRKEGKRPKDSITVQSECKEISKIEIELSCRLIEK